MQLYPLETNPQLESVAWKNAFELAFSQGANVRESPRGNPSMELLLELFICGSIAQTQVSGYVNYNVDMEPEVRQWMVGLLDGYIV